MGVGVTKPGQIGRDLKPAVQRFGPEAVIRAAYAYAENVGNLPPAQADYAGLGQFVKRVGYWIERTRKGGGVNANGDPAL